MQNVLFRLRASDFYGAFGLKPDDSIETIEKAFLRAMRRFHPARLPPDADALMRETAQELLMRANEARDILRDPTRRAAVTRLPRA
jgi:curved DNA-binding protein CbpA